MLLTVTLPQAHVSRLAWRPPRPVQQHTQAACPLTVRLACSARDGEGVLVGVGAAVTVSPWSTRCAPCFAPSEERVSHCQGSAQPSQLTLGRQGPTLWAPCPCGPARME